MVLIEIFIFLILISFNKYGEGLTLSEGIFSETEWSVPV